MSTQWRKYAGQALCLAYLCLVKDYLFNFLYNLLRKKRIAGN